MLKSGPSVCVSVPKVLESKRHPSSKICKRNDLSFVNVGLTGAVNL